MTRTKNNMNPTIFIFLFLNKKKHAKSHTEERMTRTKNNMNPTIFIS
jgi:hypothetical protein